jgi:ankyrin repeat protein
MYQEEEQPGLQLLDAIRDQNISNVKDLVDIQKVPVNFVSNFGTQPIHSAAAWNQVRIMEFLIVRGASVLATNDAGSTPLHIACQKGKMDVVKYLIEESETVSKIPSVTLLAKTDREGNTPRQVAEKYNRRDICYYFSKMVESEHPTASTFGTGLAIVESSSSQNHNKTIAELILAENNNTGGGNSPRSSSSSPTKCQHCQFLMGELAKKNDDLGKEKDKNEALSVRVMLLEKQLREVLQQKQHQVIGKK